MTSLIALSVSAESRIDVKRSVASADGRLLGWRLNALSHQLLVGSKCAESQPIRAAPLGTAGPLNVGDFNLEIQGFPRQRMIEIEHHRVVLYLGDTDNHIFTIGAAGAQ